MDFKLTEKTLKSILILGSGVVVGYCAFSAYRSWRKKQIRSIDEGFEDVSKMEDSPDKRILVLGLPNAGKSTILAQINSGNVATSKNMKPTEGFSVTTIENSGICLNIWEIGGGVRSFWQNFIQDTDLLVFVVDSSDEHSLSLAVREVKWLLADERLDKAPVLVLAHKQDLPGAISHEDVAKVLELGSVPPAKHKVRVLGTQAPPAATARHRSIDAVEALLLHLLTD